MIGVAANQTELMWVTEFFELFKTPWEPLVAGKPYQVVVIADGQTEPIDARLALVYGSDAHPLDARLGTTAQPAAAGELCWSDANIPVYGRIATFRGPHADAFVSSGQEPAGYRAMSGTTPVRRVGYDLFREVAVLLTAGQPVSAAEVPTLEMHIAIMRQCLEDEAIEFLEIPPRPHGYAFTCCLTHDVDFFGIRRHGADRTLGGFVARGTAGALADVLRGRRPLDEALRSIGAVLSLPLVYAGMASDFWHPFDDYAKADRGHPSTFYLVPFKNRPGVSPQGVVEPRRAVAYGVEDIEPDVKGASRPRTEFAVHGLDAWRDATAGSAEMAALASVTGQQKSGVRMHWLYFDDDSPRLLEEAGFEYDSTWGYNDAVGFRAGTLQVFQLPGTDALLELPLTIMDTALLYPGRMDLPREQAHARCRGIIASARRFGGALVVNWHDRSLAPERQWGASYDDVLDEVEAEKPWFATATEAVDWFRWRRSIRFEGGDDPERVTVRAPSLNEGLPPARLTVRRPGALEDFMFSGGAADVVL